MDITIKTETPDPRILHNSSKGRKMLAGTFTDFTTDVNGEFDLDLSDHGIKSIDYIEGKTYDSVSPYIAVVIPGSVPSKFKLVSGDGSVISSATISTDVVFFVIGN